MIRLESAIILSSGYSNSYFLDWDSKWYTNKKDFADYLVEDKKIREFVKRELYAAGISKILIERAAENKVKIIVLTAKRATGRAPSPARPGTRQPAIEDRKSVV